MATGSAGFGTRFRGTSSGLVTLLRHFAPLGGAPATLARSGLLSLLALALLALVIAPAALAGSGQLAWPTAGVPAFAGLGSQGSTAACPDGSGGVIVVSSVYGNGNDLFAQRVAADGTRPWGDTPKAICNADYDQDTFVCTSDGAGGVIVVWQDPRNGNHTCIYAQRLNANGVAQWTANGVLIDGSGDSFGGNDEPQVLADGSGGAIVTWLHGRVAPVGIYAQHLNGAGAAQWAAGGVSVALNTDDPDNPDPYEPTITAPSPLASDGAGGAMVSFTRCPFDNSTGNPHPWSKVYVVRLTAGGSVASTPTAAADAVSPLVDYQYSPQIVYDGSGNAIVAWEDMRHKEDGTGTAYETDLYAQKVRVTDGARLWATDGQPLCTAPAYQNAVHLVVGGANSAVAIWEDHAYDSSGWGYPYVCANRIDTSGATQWGAATTTGIRLLDIGGAMYEETMAACGDGAGGAFVAWPDYRNYVNADTEMGVYSQHLGADGTLKWGTNKEGEALWYGPHDSAYVGAPMVVCTSDGALGAAWGATLPAGDTPASVLAQKVSDSSAEIVPHLDGVSPASVVANGTFTVRGIHLGPFTNDATCRVLVNGAAANRDTWRDSWVKAVLPPELEGTVDVTVQTPRGTSNAVQLIVTRPAPVEYGCTPSTGPAGTAVDLRGDYFGLTQIGSSGHVQFLNTTTSSWTDAAVTSWTYRHIYLTVPAGLPNGWAAVKVVTDKGTATGSRFLVASTSPTPTPTPTPTPAPTPAPEPTPAPAPSPAPAVAFKLSGVKSGSIKLGRSVTAAGRVTPVSLAGSKMAFAAQFKKGGKWINAKTASAVISSTGAYSWKYRPPKKGAYRIHGVIAKTSTHAAVTTKWLSFKVK